MKNKFSKVVTWLALLLTISSSVTSPVLSFADTLEDPVKVEETTAEKASEEPEVPPAEQPEETEPEATQETQPKTEDTTNDAKANDSPGSVSGGSLDEMIDKMWPSKETETPTAENDSEKETKEEAKDESSETKSRTGEELAARSNPLDVKGLSDEEIISLAQALYGQYARTNPSFGMRVTNDAGKVIDVPFIQLRAGGTVGKPIYVSYTATKGAWSAYGEYTERLYIDGKLAYCVEPGVVFVPGGGFSSQGSHGGLTASQRVKVNEILNFGAQASDSDNFVAATGFAIWEEIGWTVKTNLSGYSGYKDRINQNIRDYEKVPSFSNDKKAVKTGETVTFEDKNGVLKDFFVEDDGGFTVKINGNKLEVTAKASSKDGAVVLERKQKNTENMMFWVKDGSQTVATAGSMDPTLAVARLEVEQNGRGRINKKDANNKAVQGAKFTASQSGKEVASGTSNASGLVDFGELPSGTYDVKEIATVAPYVLDKATKKMTIKAGETTTIDWVNEEQTAKVTLVKQDSETGNTPQGGASLAGAVYGLYQADGKKIKEVTLKNVNGRVQAEVSDLKVATNYYFQEIKAPEGYLLDTTKHNFKIDYAGQDKEVATDSVTVKEDVIKGNIDGHKIGSKGLLNDFFGPDVKPTLEGVELTATSKTTNKTYKAVTDENGYYKFSNLPYDTYTISETKGIEGYKLIAPFDVVIKDHNYTHHFILEDKAIESLVQVIKTDEETGKTIPRADAKFQIKDLTTGKWLEQRKPNSLDITTIFETNEEGYLVTSEMLAYGKDRYELWEIEAPEGYLLADKPVVFSITDQAVNIVSVKFGDTPIKGKVEVEKIGEQLTAAMTDSEFGPLYTFGVQDAPLDGAEFSFYAAEDISTNDGTLRYKENALVDTGVTEGGKLVMAGLNGIEGEEGASASGFYVGEYYAIETKAPAGNVLTGEKIPFVIENTDEIERLTVKMDVKNVLQEIEINVHKEQEKITGLDGEGKALTENVPGNGQTFGLYTVNGIEGLEIPENSLVGLTEVKEGIATFNDKLPAGDYFVKELQAPQNYVMDEKEYHFTIENTNDAKVIYDIYNEDGQPLLNEIIPPVIGTQAHDGNGKQLVDPLKELPVYDDILYKNIDPSKNHVVVSELRDRATLETVEKFETVPELEDFTGIWTFKGVIDGQKYAGRQLYWAEFWYEDGILIAEHDDPTDPKQWYEIANPTIHTEATFKDGAKVAYPVEETEIPETVTLEGLIPGNTYTYVVGAKDLLEGKAIEGIHKEVTFVAESDTYTATHDFVVDGRLFIGNGIRFTENVYPGETVEPGNEIIIHDNPKDTFQTVEFTTPKITTKATGLNGEKVLEATKGQKVKEVATLEGAIPGQEIELIVKGHKVSDRSVQVERTLTFVPDKETFEVPMTFEVDGELFVNDGLVFTEVWKSDGKIVTDHINYESKAQTVRFKPVKIFPATGETMTTLFTVIGAMVVIAAGAAFVYRKKEQK
jgi:Predicted outer membrane protein